MKLESAWVDRRTAATPDDAIDAAPLADCCHDLRAADSDVVEGPIVPAAKLGCGLIGRGLFGASNAPLGHNPHQPMAEIADRLETRALGKPNL
jgi:hypothetical protein